MATIVKNVPVSSKVALLCLLLSATSCCGDLFGSLRFTRNALFGFSRVVANPSTESPQVESHDGRSSGGTNVETQPQRRTIHKPSNKFLETLNEVEKAVANAGAMGNRLRYSEKTLATLSRLLSNSVKSKNYGYATDVMGKILHLLSKSARRRKRTSESERGTKENEGQVFLQNLREDLGNETFDSFMAVKGDVSLMFVVDDTGSMSEEIEAVKRIATAMINYPRKTPVQYILSPFNDPMSDAGEIAIKENSESKEFIQAIDALSASSGGDCPEYTFEGIIKALEQSERHYSPMYVFTDAGPKDDETRIKLVEALVKYRDIKVNFLATGSCGSKLDPAFRQLAEMTSGQARLLKSAQELEKFKNLTGGILEGTSVISFGSSRVSGRMRRSFSEPSRYRFPVDDSIETLKVSVETQRESNGRGITLRDPTGAIITAQKVILIQLSVYQILNPSKGNWTLEISTEETGDHDVSAESSSETNIDFKHYFMIPMGSGRRKAQVPFANPVTGKLNKMVLRLLAEEEKVNPRSLRLQIVTKSGAVSQNVSLVPKDSEHFEVSFIPPSTPFKLKLLGITQEGHAFERLTHRPIEPSTAFLRGKYASNDFTLPLNDLTFIHFEICNFGPSEQFEVFVRNDSMDYILQYSASSERPTYVGKDRCATIFVTAMATRVSDVCKTDWVVFIVKGRSSGALLSQVMRLLVVNPKKGEHVCSS